MLGLDVHDCAAADTGIYPGGDLEEGMVLTVEPGLYFQEDDLLVPEELRGIGIRIEDDVVVTADGVRNLSEALPRQPDAIEAWMARLRAESSVFRPICTLGQGYSRLLAHFSPFRDLKHLSWYRTRSVLRGVRQRPILNLLSLYVAVLPRTSRRSVPCDGSCSRC